MDTPRVQVGLGRPAVPAPVASPDRAQVAAPVVLLEVVPAVVRVVPAVSVGLRVGVAAVAAAIRTSSSHST